MNSNQRFKYGRNMFLLLLLFSCSNEKDFFETKSKIKEVFTKTESIKISNDEKKTTLRISDNEINIIETYLHNKSDFLLYLLGNKLDNNVIEIKLAVRDSIQFSKIYKAEEIQEVKDKYDRNNDYFKLSKIVFKNFNLSEYWNLEKALYALGNVDTNKDLGFSNTFEMLYEMTNENELIEKRKRVGVLLTEGYKLINSAGMSNFWNHDELLETSELASDMNLIFNYLKFKTVSTQDSMLFVEGKHVITFE